MRGTRKHTEQETRIKNMEEQNLELQQRIRVLEEGKRKSDEERDHLQKEFERVQQSRKDEESIPSSTGGSPSAATVEKLSSDLYDLRKQLSELAALITFNNSNLPPPVSVPTTTSTPTTTEPTVPTPPTNLPPLPQLTSQNNDMSPITTSTTQVASVNPKYPYVSTSSSSQQVSVDQPQNASIFTSPSKNDMTTATPPVNQASRDNSIYPYYVTSSPHFQQNSVVPPQYASTLTSPLGNEPPSTALTVGQASKDHSIYPYVTTSPIFQQNSVSQPPYASSSFDYRLRVFVQQAAENELKLNRRLPDFPISVDNIRTSLETFMFIASAQKFSIQECLTYFAISLSKEKNGAPSMWFLNSPKSTRTNLYILMSTLDTNFHNSLTMSARYAKLDSIKQGNRPIRDYLNEKRLAFLSIASLDTNWHEFLQSVLKDIAPTNPIMLYELTKLPLKSYDELMNAATTIENAFTISRSLITPLTLNATHISSLNATSGQDFTRTPLSEVKCYGCGEQGHSVHSCDNTDDKLKEFILKRMQARYQALQSDPQGDLRTQIYDDFWRDIKNFKEQCSESNGESQ